jgi:predicted nuclease with TOPRIM domain
MATKTRAILAEFYRDFVQPDTDRVLREFSVVREEVAEYRRDNERHFDQLYKRLDTIESEIQALRVAVKRLEDEFATMTADRAELRQEVEQLKGQIAELQKKVEAIEAQL